ncbi:acyl carrier protein [Cryptosporangium sp. NPDC051539]|uniref:acyl carrier protein n=1 Tax=Cryptosporangium sp. NPDC051539 TaxID=3363962 RepID=UPI0037BDADBE
MELWKQILRTDDITLDDDFFDLGGNSIAAIRLVPEIEERFGVEPHVLLVFDYSTPRRMAVALTELGATPPAGSPAGSPADSPRSPAGSPVRPEPIGPPSPDTLA